MYELYKICSIFLKLLFHYRRYIVVVYEGAELFELRTRHFRIQIFNIFFILIHRFAVVIH